MPTSQLPSELWHIFAFTWTNGGHTGHSLSLASRYIGECSRPFTLQPVAVHGSRQTLAFVAVLGHTSVHSRHCTMHLFSSNRESTSSSVSSVPSKWNALASTVFASLSPTCARAKSLEDAMERDIQMVHALYSIINMCTYSTLRTLAILFYCHHTVFPAHVPPSMCSPRVLDSHGAQSGIYCTGGSRFP
ncbi:hypothetical protein FIBSPDRAFT_946751 [Athelia psychrophila]|uniref:Uncharacterized protein n=1 Tax=Athelia psychrophila TaxID=1759441 RepID=A0A166SID9_9AGAM|nr:hypothetical protein FIBSPDRAFT_193487 [Fibularhizoctonia sp. CBS 109695]KZP29483.1 hypothetical protein FIBSPDRAFT_946751 [Fibularhizoctonia sp. CBS 109695]